MKKLQGIIPHMVTPLKGDGTIDVDGTARLVEHMNSGGVHGLFLLGTTGEAQSLSNRCRYDIVELVCRLAAGRVPVIVGITDTSMDESVKLAEHAKRCGAVAVVSAPPYYFAPSQQELIEYYTALADALPLPLYLYNMPSHVKVSFAPATVLRIAQNPRVVGFKDSSANAVYFQSVMHVMKCRPDFAMLVGPEEMTAEAVLMGAHGGINGGANMFPRLYVDMYNAAKAGDLETLKRLQPIIMQISTTIYTIGQHGSSYLKGLKCALSILGICDDFVAMPFHKFNAPERERVRLALEALPVIK